MGPSSLAGHSKSRRASLAPDEVIVNESSRRPTIRPQVVNPDDLLNPNVRAHYINLESLQRSRKWVLEKRRPITSPSSSAESLVSLGRHSIPFWTDEAAPIIASANNDTASADIEPTSNAKDKYSNLFRDQVAHLTKSSVFLKSSDRGDILYEKDRIRTLKSRESVYNRVLEMEKLVQGLNLSIGETQYQVGIKTAKLATVSKRRELLGLLLAQLLKQKQIYQDRATEGERLQAQVSTASSIAARKAKANRQAAVKGSMLGGSTGMGAPNRARGSRASIMVNPKGSSVRLT